MRLPVAIVALMCLGGSIDPSHTTYRANVSDPGPEASTGQTFGATFTNSSLSQLPPTMTVNGTTLTLVLSYQGKDATASAWPAADGLTGTLSKVESGVDFVIGADTPLLDSADKAVNFQAGDVYAAADAGLGDIGTQDFVLEYVMDKVGAQSVNFGKLANVYNNCVVAGTAQGFAVAQGSSFSSIAVCDGAGNKAAVALTHAVTTTSHVVCFADRSLATTNGLKCYTNGGPEVGVALSTVGSLSSAQRFVVGGSYNSGAPWENTTSEIALVRMWKCPDATPACLDNSDTTEEQAIATDRASRLFGHSAQIAGGSPVPTTMTRASTAYLRKTSGGVSTLFGVGNNWVRADSDNVNTGLLKEPAIASPNGNVLLQSDSLAASWTEADAGDTQSLNDAAAPDPLADGATTADCNIADASDGPHGFSQAATLTAAVWTLSIFAKAGNKTWLYLSDDTVANATSYFNLSTCVVGTKGAGVIDQFVDDYGDFCRIGISFTGTAAAHTLKWLTADADADNTVTGDAATQNTCVWGAQAELYAHPLSYLPTTTAAVGRTADNLTYSSAGNADRFGGSIVVRAWMPSHNNIVGPYLAELNDATANNRVAIIANATESAWLYVANGGVVQASITDTTTDISNGAIHTVVGRWTTNYFRPVVDGVAEGTVDISGSVPASLTTIRVGSAIGGAVQFGGHIQSIKIYNRPEALE